MDFSMTSKRSCSGSSLDRISSLPDELLCRILALLPTKDAAVTSVFSKKFMRAFSWITKLDFDDSPISYRSSSPRSYDDFETFKRFVDGVLKSFQFPYLSSFRLRLGGDMSGRYRHICHITGRECSQDCLPVLEPTQLNAWLSFPLARGGIREIDLCIHVREPLPMLPITLFTCDTLEVLKLDVHLDLEQVCTMRSYCLPNLKVLHLRSVFLTEDDFLTRLVSSCPSLEDLVVEFCGLVYGRFISISSPSLKRLVLDVYRPGPDEQSNHVLIDTPNLQYFHYCDSLALHYSIKAMNALAKAHISVSCWTLNSLAFKSMLSLVRVFSNVPHLSLVGDCIEVLEFGLLKDQLPMLRNLNYLELGATSNTYWDNALPDFLKSSPFLGTLVFPKGLVVLDDIGWHVPNELGRNLRTTQLISCCSHLKRIVIKKWWGFPREENLVKFLLGNASALEELVIFRNTVDEHIEHLGLCFWSDLQHYNTTLKSKLETLPRASNNCTIIVR